MDFDELERSAAAASQRAPPPPDEMRLLRAGKRKPAMSTRPPLPTFGSGHSARTAAAQPPAPPTTSYAAGFEVSPSSAWDEGPTAQGAASAWASGVPARRPVARRDTTARAQSPNGAGSQQNGAPKAKGKGGKGKKKQQKQKKGKSGGSAAPQQHGKDLWAAAGNPFGPAGGASPAVAEAAAAEAATRHAHSGASIIVDDVDDAWGAGPTAVATAPAASAPAPVTTSTAVLERPSPPPAAAPNASGTPAWWEPTAGNGADSAPRHSGRDGSLFAQLQQQARPAPQRPVPPRTLEREGVAGNGSGLPTRPRSSPTVAVRPGARGVTSAAAAASAPPPAAPMPQPVASVAPSAPVAPSVPVAPVAPVVPRAVQPRAAAESTAEAPARARSGMDEAAAAAKARAQLERLRALRKAAAAAGVDAGTGGAAGPAAALAGAFAYMPLRRLFMP